MSKRLKSSIWSHFTVICEKDKTAKCDICKFTMSYKSSITNLKKHMERKHPTIQLNNVDNDFSRISESVTSENLNSKSLPVMSILDEGAEAASGSEFNNQNHAPIPSTSRSTSTPVVKPQSSIISFVTKKITVTSKKKLDSLLLNLFSKDYQPFSIVEDEGFKEFVKALNPSYELPSRKTISKTLIPAAYEQCANLVKQKLLSVTSVCLTTDCWTSPNSQSFIAVTAHFIDNEFNLISALLECSCYESSHTSNNLASELKRIVNDFNFEDKILLAVSDNAANIRKAISTDLGWKHFGCYAHTLNLIVNDALEFVSDVIDKIKIIVTFFKRSTVANQKLLAYQKNSGNNNPKKVIQNVLTRWNSTYYMIKRFIELEDAIRSTLGLIDKDLPRLSPDEWQMAGELCKVLKPFEEITKQMSSENFVTGSHVIVFTRGLVSVCKMFAKQPFHESMKIVVDELLKGLETRFKNIEFSKTVALSTFLDPRFKMLGFSNKNAAEQIKKHATELLTKEIGEERLRMEPEESASTVCKTGDEFSVWSEFDDIVANTQPAGTANSAAIVEIQRYLEDGVVPRSHNALEWWKRHESVYPKLAKLVKSKFNIVATSVPSERIFSKTGYLLSDRRSRLSANKVQKLIFLKVNLKLV